MGMALDLNGLEGRGDESLCSLKISSCSAAWSFAVELSQVTMITAHLVKLLTILQFFIYNLMSHNINFLLILEFNKRCITLASLSYCKKI